MCQLIKKPLFWYKNHVISQPKSDLITEWVKIHVMYGMIVILFSIYNLHKPYSRSAIECEIFMTCILVGWWVRVQWCMFTYTDPVPLCLEVYLVTQLQRTYTHLQGNFTYVTITQGQVNYPQKNHAATGTKTKNKNCSRYTLPMF